MKKISVLIPCYNEVENVVPMSEAVVDIIQRELSEYDYELVFIDNCSEDGTREKLEEICSQNKKIKAIFNVTNFGQFNSPFYGMCQTTGDCTISMCCDFQDPLDMIPKFIDEWEKGYKIVCGIKTSSKENGLMYALRSIYYKTVRKLSKVDQIEHFTGFGLYDDLATHAGAGTLVPITGFANAVVSPAIEFKTEGFILGLGAKMFVIAGPVIVYGISASVVYGIIYWITTLF